MRHAGLASAPSPVSIGAQLRETDSRTALETNNISRMFIRRLFFPPVRLLAASVQL